MIKVTEFVSTAELANMMSVAPTQIISACFSLGMMVTQNQTIDADTAELIVEEFGHKVVRVSDSDVEDVINEIEDDEKDLKDRPPVITIMGHVDHGKTSLLDYIRKSNVVSVVSGGITQSDPGRWERGISEATDYQGMSFNPGNDVNTDCFEYSYVTGLASAGSAGGNDVDDYNTVLESPVFSLQNNQNHLTDGATALKLDNEISEELSANNEQQSIVSLDDISDEDVEDHEDSVLRKQTLEIDSDSSEHQERDSTRPDSHKFNSNSLEENRKFDVEMEIVVEQNIKRLQELNSDYEAKRYKNMTLDSLEMHIGRENLFHDWLKDRNKLGGQNKIPRLSNSREFVDILLEMNR